MKVECDLTPAERAQIIAEQVDGLLTRADEADVIYIESAVLRAILADLEAARKDAIEARRAFESKALAAIAAERRGHVEREGWTAEHDDAHATGDLARAAACYALSGGRQDDGSDHPALFAVRDNWPWDWSWWKPKDRRRDLVRAGSLIVAEIERLDRISDREASE